MQTETVRRRFGLVALLVIGSLWLAAIPQGNSFAAYPTADLVIYDDTFASGWDPAWSYNTTYTNANSPKQFGNASLAVTHQQPYGGLSVHVPGGNGATLSTAGYTGVSFWAYGGSGAGTQLQFYIQTGDEGGESAAVPFTASPSWQQFTFNFSTLGNPAAIARITMQEAAGATPPTYYVDDMRLVGATASVPLTATSTATRLPNNGLTLSVDVAADRRAISPYIYGLHYTTEALADELDLPVRRWGGNDTTRYNWQFDLSNNGLDYYFENNKTRDLSADQFIQRDRRTGTQTIVTVPMSGWVAKNDPQACGFSTVKYGAQQSTDPFRTQCGNGIRPDGSRITGNDPADTSIAAAPGFVQGWVDHLVQTHGAATNGGVLFYSLDNEPDLWNSTHRDVHPNALSYDELRDRTLQYGAVVKAADPGAEILGPDSFGWSGYFYSALDLELAAQNGYTSFPDRAAHGNIPLVPWYLGQMRAYEQANGARLLDYLDLHFYPQNGVGRRDAGDGATQALRLRSTRALWDPTYRDESYIGGDDQAPEMRQVRLIPRMREWVDQNYPGTKLAITEYNWGAFEHINGALAQADILGIFGREGVDLATMFDDPFHEGHFTPTSPGAFAFRMFRNYDGNGAKFGDTYVRSTSTDQEKLAIYGAQHSADGTLTIMVVNKTGGDLASNVALSGFTHGGSAEVYRYSAANLGAIQHLAAQPAAANGFATNFPANSITLFRLAAAAPGPPATATMTSMPDPNATATLTGTPGPSSTPGPSPTPTATSPGGTQRKLFLPLVQR